ncbi:MAG: hypothetical protein HC812_20055 [Leptolyngbya sp. RL_3_1]|nr:hypothetical protein [Leptolyngbya sp. RL_3_1]
MTTQAAVQAFEAIIAHAEQHRDDSERRIRNPLPGQLYAQGDVNFLILANIPPQAKPSAPVRQLAPGTTRGSRHCIAEADMAGIDFFAYPDPQPLEGPVLRLDRQARIEHPEHGDHVYPAGTIVAVGYQRRYADEVRRIQD